MYFKRKSNIIFRNYGLFGYITDNRNFGYIEENVIGDKIVSQSGSVFLSVLDKTPQKIEHLLKKIGIQFKNVEIETIKSDVIEFYNTLETEGFITSGNSIIECNDNDEGFSYKTSKLDNKNIQKSKKHENDKSTIDFFEEYYNGESQLTNLHVEITSKCNEKCIHCYIPNEKKLEAMDSNMFFSILEQCKDMNLLNITISGGEPMLHHNFIDFLKKCNEYNFSVNILSNLTMLNDKILEEMKKNQLLSVQVSLYSIQENIHDSITQLEGSYNKTKSGILKLIDNDIPLQISCPILKQNINCSREVINWGIEHNVNVASDYVIIAAYDHTLDNLNSRLDICDVEKHIIQKINCEPDYIKSIELEAIKKRDIKQDDFICSICNSTICIRENGDVYPCAGWQDNVLGNIINESLSDVWSNSSKIKYLRNLKRSDFPKCLECDASDYCTMCMVRNANEDVSGNPLELNQYFCDVTKLNKKLIQDSK